MNTASEGTLVRGDAGSEQHLAGGGVSGMRGPSARRHSPAAALAWPATHLASSSRGVSGHFAAKCAVTALDAVAVLAPSRASHSATERRSSRSTFADPARAIARRGKRETPRCGPLLPVLLPPTSGGGSCSPLLGGSWARACVAGEVQGRNGGSPRVDAGLLAVAGPPRGCSEGLPPEVSGSLAFHTNQSLAGAAQAQLVREPPLGESQFSRSGARLGLRNDAKRRRRLQCVMLGEL